MGWVAVGIAIAPLDTPATRAVCGSMQSAIHAASSPRLHAVCGQSTAGGWSIWPAAWSISPAAVSSSSIRSKAVPDSAARGEIGGAPRTLQRAQKSARPSDFARGSTGPLGGGQRAARRQGGLERGGCLGWLLVGADNRERDGTGEGDALHIRQPFANHLSAYALPKPQQRVTAIAPSKLEHVVGVEGRGSYLPWGATPTTPRQLFHLP